MMTATMAELQRAAKRVFESEVALKNMVSDMSFQCCDVTTLATVLENADELRAKFYQFISSISLLQKAQAKDLEARVAAATGAKMAAANDQPQPAQEVIPWAN